MEQLFPYKTKDFVQWGSLIDLINADAAWAAFDKRVRTSVRKGEGMGVVIRPYRSEDLPIVTPFTPNADDIPALWKARHHAYVAEAKDTGEILGWILLAGVVGTKKLFMLCHASTPEGKRRQTPNLLLWHAVKTWAGPVNDPAEDGAGGASGVYRFLDVGVSYRPSLQEYFEGFRQFTYPMVMSPPALPIGVRFMPFDTAAYGLRLGKPSEGRTILNRAFGTEDITIFPHEAFALAACLREYRDQGRLGSHDEVLITSAVESAYPPAHITQAVEQVCRRSSEPSERTRVVLLIHSYGLPHPRTTEWRRFCDERGIPLIEELSEGWGSEGTGTWGDVRIASTTRLLPLQFGAVLAGMAIPFERMWNVHACSDLGKEDEILGGVAAHWQDTTVIRESRQRIWRRYADNLQSVCDPLFDLAPGVMPYMYVATMKHAVDAERVAAFVREFGVEAATLDRPAAVALPCHQRMTDRHADFVCGSVLANFREGCGIPH